MSGGSAPSGRGELAVAAGLGLAALALYAATLSRHYSGDSLVYVWELDFGTWIDLVDPYHLLLHPLQLGWVELWRACGWEGSTMLPLQLINAVGGALSVALVFAIVARAGGSRPAAALAAAGCAVSGGLWLVSTEAEGVALPLPVHLGILALLLRLPAGEPRAPGRAFALGTLLGFGAWAYATFALLLPVALLVQWQGRRRSAVAILALIAGFLLLVVAAALFVSGAKFGVSNWHVVYGYYGGGSLYGILAWENLPRGLYAFLRTLVLYPGLGINDRTVHFLARASTAEKVSLAATYLAVAVAAATPLWLVWRHRAELDRALLQRLAVWAAAFAAFALFWVPSDLEFWVPLGVAWFVVTGLVLARGLIAPWVAVLAIVVLLVANGNNLILPHHQAAPKPDTDVF